MENTYVIAWKSKSCASFGRSKKRFTRAEAEQLADELNQDYPKFLHEALNLHPLEATGEGVETLTNTIASRGQEAALA